MCYLCVNKIEDADFLVICPNKFCQGKFLSQEVKKLRTKDEYQKFLEAIELKLEKERGIINECKKEKIQNTEENVYNTQNITQIEYVETEQEIKIIDVNKIKINGVSNSNQEKIDCKISNFQPTVENFFPVSVIENYSPIKIDDSKNSFRGSSTLHFDEKLDSQVNKNLSNISNTSKEISNFNNLSFKTLCDDKNENKNKKTVNCPICFIKITLNDGKNLITCHSRICQGRNNFCRLCLSLIDNIINYQSHFPKGLYINKCNGINNRINSTNRTSIL